jgi:hypothetical protein
VFPATHFTVSLMTFGRPEVLLTTDSITLALAVVQVFALLWPEFDPGPVRIGFVVCRVSLGQVIVRILSIFTCHCHSTSLTPYNIGN